MIRYNHRVTDWGKKNCGRGEVEERDSVILC
jgi:hypothetical protein